MKPRRSLYITLSIAFAAALALTLIGAPSRVPSAEQDARNEVQLRLNRVYAETEKDAATPAPPADAAPEAPAASAQEKEDVMWPETAPDTFKVKFECTNGDFTIECHKEWAPLGVERFYALVQESFFDDSGFFRVVPGFVVQFGLAADPAVTAKWKSNRLKDDPVTQSNLSGYITFATSGPNSRTTQLFINTGSNERLDGMGFSPFGKVIEGMDVVNGINAQYGERPNQGMITAEGSAYLHKNFPKLDFIKKATLVK